MASGFNIVFIRGEVGRDANMTGGTSQRKRIRLIEPGSRPGLAFSHYVRQWPLLGPIYLGTVLAEHGHDIRVYNENISGSVLDNPTSDPITVLP